jgi:hypothetical protein
MILFARIFLIFIARLLDVLFPVFWILLAAFVIFYGKKIRCSFKENSACRILIFYALICFFLRFFLFFSGVPYQGRYFHPLILASVFPAAAGVAALGGYLNRFKIKNAILILAMIVCGICIGKALKPPSEKKWIREIPELIKAKNKSSKPPVIVGTSEDGRIAYYAEAEYHLLQPDINLFEKCDAFVLQSDSSPAKNLDKTITDAFLKTSYAGTGSVEILVVLPQAQFLKYLNFDWENPVPNDEIRTEVEFSETDDGTFDAPKIQSSDCDIIILAEETPAKRVLFKIKCGKNTKWQLRDVFGYGFDSYKIFSIIQYKNDMRWVPDNFSPGFQSFGEAIQKWGGENVFVLVNLPVAEINSAMEKREIPLPFEFIGEFTDHKKQKISIFQGKKQ